eukprot:3441537-Alexandrium_andersonii.AAC.1
MKKGSLDVRRIRLVRAYLRTHVLCPGALIGPSPSKNDRCLSPPRSRRLARSSELVVSGWVSIRGAKTISESS